MTFSRIKETTTSTSASVVRLNGAQTGYLTFTKRHAIGDTGIEVVIDDRSGRWLEGVYTLTDATTLTRTAILSSSNNDGDVTFLGDTKDVYETVSGASLSGGLVNANDPGFDIVLCAGQSNMEGNPASDPLIDVGDPRVFQWANSSADTASYRQIIAGADPLYMPGGVRTGKTGPATWFAKAYLMTVPGNRRVLLVPVAVGSTGMVGSYWQPGSPGGQYYERAISDTNLAITAALQMFPRSRFVGTIWAQGEADGLVPVSQADYAMNLKALIAGFRSRITGAANSWFIIQAMTPEGIVNHTGEAAIDAAHRQVAQEVSKCAYVAGVSGMSADVHYTAAGIRVMGTRLGLAVTSAMKSVGVDNTVPIAVSAKVANATPTTVAIAMSEVLDSGYVPAATAFTVSGHTVSAVAISGSTINLTVQEAFVSGEAARTVAYTQPGANNARDVAGNLLASFTGLTITNSVAATDTTAPTFVSAAVANATPSRVDVTMSETLAAVTPAAAAFSVSGGKTVTAVSISGAVVSLTVSSAYVSSDVITVTYTKPGTSPLQDAAGNQTASFGPSGVTNNVAAPASTVTGVTVSPATASVAGGATQTFTATVSGTNSPSQGVTWSSNAGSITSGGVFTAPAATASDQTITITATSTQDNTKSGTATVTVAASAGTSTMTFSPTDKDASITLSNGNLTMAGTTSGFKSVRTTAGKTSGKWYWEVKLNTAGPVIIGLGTAVAPLTTFPGGDNATGESIGYYSANGSRYYKGDQITGGATFAANDVIGIRLDMDGKTAEFFKNGVSQYTFVLNGDGTAALPLISASAVFPMVSPNGAGISVTANFGGSAFVYAPPSGYSAIGA